MEAHMASANDRTLATWAMRDGRRLRRNLLGGLVILVVWLSLWALGGARRRAPAVAGAVSLPRRRDDLAARVIAGDWNRRPRLLDRAPRADPRLHAHARLPEEPGGQRGDARHARRGGLPPGAGAGA